MVLCKFSMEWRDFYNFILACLCNFISGHIHFHCALVLLNKVFWTYNAVIFLKFWTRKVKNMHIQFFTWLLFSLYLHTQIRYHFCYDTLHNYRQNHSLVLCPTSSKFKLGGPHISPDTILGLPLSMALMELCCLWDFRSFGHFKLFPPLLHFSSCLMSTLSNKLYSLKATLR